MNRLLFFIIIFTIIIFTVTGCTSCFSVCEDSDCENIEIGHAELRDSSVNWLHSIDFDNFYFINSNGFQTQFAKVGFEESVNYSFCDTYDYNCGDPMEPCYEYYTFSEEFLTFESTSINMTLKYEIRKNVSYNDCDIATDTLSDILFVYLNEYVMPIPIESENMTEIECFTETIDTLILNDHTYYDIIHSYKNIDPEVLTLKGVYYSKDNGIVGFYLTNNEVWFLEF
jgi:hypothetical protein